MPLFLFQISGGLDGNERVKGENDLNRGTRVSGRFAIPVAVTNHKSTKADFKLLVNQVLKLGSELHGEDNRPFPVCSS